MSMATLAHSTRKAARACQVIDPRTMGRPVHLLGRYTERLRKDLAELFHVRFNRRYRAQFEIGELGFEAATAQGARRWLTYSSDVGRLAFAADRNVLLCILAYRYGVPSNGVQEFTAAAESSELETATEERLAARLGRQLIGAAADAIEALQPDAGESRSSGEFSPIPAPPGEAAWTLRVRVTERTHRLDGTLWIRFDEPWIERLMRGLAPHRERGSSQNVSGTRAQPLPARLQLTLNARLVDKPIELGTLLDLRIGDIIPVTLASTDVLIGDERLFTASVAEHKGKLCLTCFEDVE